MEFDIEGHTYRANKMPAREQFHITRRLLPVISALAGSKQDESIMLDQLVSAIGKMSDTEADYVLFGILKHVERKVGQGMGWSKVSTETALMYDDITMPAMMQIAFRCFKHNMGGFMDALPQVLPGAPQKQNAQ